MKSKQLLAVLVPLSLGVINTTYAVKEKKQETNKVVIKELAITTPVQENKKKKKIKKNVVVKPKDLNDIFKLAQDVKGGKNLTVKPKTTADYLKLNKNLMIKPNNLNEALNIIYAIGLGDETNDYHATVAALNTIHRKKIAQIKQPLHTELLKKRKRVLKSTALLRPSNKQKRKKLVNKYTKQLNEKNEQIKKLSASIAALTKTTDKKENTGWFGFFGGSDKKNDDESNQQIII